MGLGVQITGDLRFKLVYLISQVRDNALIGTNMKVDHLLVRFNSHLDVFGSICIFKSVYGLLVLIPRGTDGGYHDSLAVSS